MSVGQALWRERSLRALLEVAEGAARFGADRAQAAACVEALQHLGLAPASETAVLLGLLGRLAAMITRLIR